VGQAGLVSDEHLSVDGTLLEAWASLKSFQPKERKTAPPPDNPGNPTVDSPRDGPQFPSQRTCWLWASMTLLCIDFDTFQS